MSISPTPQRDIRPSATLKQRHLPSINCWAALLTSRALYAIVFLMWLASGASANSGRNSELDAIYEVSFRYMFSNNASGQQKSAGVYCLAVGGEDPAAEFLARFAGFHPPIRKASDCTASIEEGVLEKATGVRGLQFRIDEIRNKTSTTAEVIGGYYEGGLSSSGNVYFLEKKDGLWVVVRDVMEWIS
jgi:hypothetical protein